MSEISKKHFSSLKSLDNWLEETKIVSSDAPFFKFGIAEDERTDEQVCADLKLAHYTLINFLGKIDSKWIEMVDDVIITKKELDFIDETTGNNIVVIDNVVKSEPHVLTPHPNSKILKEINNI